MSIESQSGSRLVIFDVEGIILPARKFLVFEIAKSIGVGAMLHVAWAGFLYNIGLISIKKALRAIYGALRGVEVNQVLRVYRGMSLLRGAVELFSRLRQTGSRTALVSSGLPSFVVEDLASRLGADFGVGCEVEAEAGRLTGNVSGEVIEPDGKATVLREILRKVDPAPSRCVAVVNDRNNLPMMALCGRRIGFNPDLFVNLKSEYVVNSHDLMDALPYIIEDDVRLKGRRSKLTGNDLFRALIHINGFWVSVISIFLLDRLVVLSVISLVTLLYGVSEYLRESGRELPGFFQVTRRAAVGTEVYGVAVDPILYSAGIVLSLVLFPPPICYACVSVLTLGDGFASIFGKLVGRTVVPFNKPKKLEGSLAGFLFAALGASLFVGPFAAVLAAAVAMLVECSPLPVNDNLSIPLVAGLMLMTIVGV